MVRLMRWSGVHLSAPVNSIAKEKTLKYKMFATGYKHGLFRVNFYGIVERVFVVHRPRI